MEPSLVRRKLLFASDSHRPGLEPWMEARWARVLEVISDAMKVQKKQEQWQARQLEAGPLELTVTRSRLPKLMDKADQLGVQLTTYELDRDMIYQEERRYLSFQRSQSDPSGVLSTKDLKRLNEIVDDKLKRYVGIRLSAPPIEDRPVADATMENGDLLLQNFPFEKPYWNKERKDAFEFGYCDICHTARNRQHTYIIYGEKHGYRQVGGECAKNLDLARKVSSLVKGFEVFRNMVEAEMANEDDRPGRPRSVMFPERLALVIRVIIGMEGYVSGKQAKEAEENGRPLQSTASITRGYMLNPQATMYQSIYKAVRQTPPEEGERLLERLKPYSEYLLAESERTGRGFELAEGVRHAIQAGGPNSVGYLAWAISTLEEWEARNQGTPHAWLPSARITLKEPIRESIWGPENYEAVDDKRMQITVQAGTEPLTQLPGRQATPQIRVACEQPILLDAICKLLKGAILPEGIYVHLSLRVNSKGILDGLAAGTEDPYVGYAEKMARTALYRVTDAFVYHYDIDSLKAYAAQEPKTLVSFLGAEKALQKGVLTKKLENTLAGVIPGVWKCVRAMALPVTRFGAPVLYTLVRSDGAQVKWKASNPYKVEGNWDMRDLYVAQSATLQPGDEVHLRGNFGWPVPFRGGEMPVGTLSRATAWFIHHREGSPLPDRLLKANA